MVNTRRLWGTATAVAHVLRRRFKVVMGAAVLLIAGTICTALWLHFSRSPTDRYRRIVNEAAKRHVVPPALVMAIIRQESNFDPHARGKAGEVGLMQITEPAAKDWVRHTGHTIRSKAVLFDPRLNIEIGTWYLARGLQKWRHYRDRKVLALAQYNAGPGNARKWAPEDPRENALDFVRFPGTRKYINSVLSYERLYRQRHSKR